MNRARIHRRRRARTRRQLAHLETRVGGLESLAAPPPAPDQLARAINRELIGGKGALR